MARPFRNGGRHDHPGQARRVSNGLPTPRTEVTRGNPHAALLALQRTAGNRAVAAMASNALLAVQRVGKISDKDLGDLQLSLSLFTPQKAGLKKLASDKNALEKISFKYGIADPGPYDQYRANPTPAKDQLLVSAGRELRALYEASPQLDQAIGGAFDRKDLKARLSKDEAELFGYLSKLWPRLPVLYSNRGGDKRVFLPTPGVIKKAPGRVGQTLRALISKGFVDKTIDDAEVNLIYESFKQDPWRYDPQVSPSPHALILQQINTAVCGAFAGALVEMVELVADARGVANPATLGKHQGLFVTIPYQYGFIDPRVRGNIEAIEGHQDGYATVNRAFFRSHTWMVSHGHTYDPLGMRRDIDFRDNDIGPLQVSSGGVTASNEEWDLIPALTAPPAGFSGGYRLRPKA